MSNARLKADINELKNISAEIKRLNELLKPLRQRKKELEDSILQFFESTGVDEGINKIKLNDIEIVSVDKVKHDRVSKTEKENTAVQFLQSKGVHEAKQVYNDLIEALKGPENQVKSLKMKEVRNRG